LFGRRAGTVAGYPYSPALRNSAIVWTEQTVDRLFALGPHIVTPGSKMPLQRMADPSERAALIAYLRRQTKP
jgi:cytochrome c